MSQRMHQVFDLKIGVAKGLRKRKASPFGVQINLSHTWCKKTAKWPCTYLIVYTSKCVLLPLKGPFPSQHLRWAWFKNWNVVVRVSLAPTLAVWTFQCPCRRLWCYLRPNLDIRRFLVKSTCRCWRLLIVDDYCVVYVRLCFVFAVVRDLGNIKDIHIYIILPDLFVTSIAVTYPIFLLPIPSWWYVWIARIDHEYSGTPNPQLGNSYTLPIFTLLDVWWVTRGNTGGAMEPGILGKLLRRGHRGCVGELDGFLLGRWTCFPRCQKGQVGDFKRGISDW